jgi:8-oxo-dGTP diphosphatase
VRRKKTSVRKPAGYDPSHYERPSVTVDVVALRLREPDRRSSTGDLEVLLIRRKNHPYKGFWAIPGGFIEKHERLEKSAAREFREEAGVSVSPQRLVQFFTAGDPARDPRTRVISVVFLTILSERESLASAGDDAADVCWFSLFRLPRLAFDHKMILGVALRRIRDDMKIGKIYLQDFRRALRRRAFRSVRAKLLADEP